MSDLIIKYGFQNISSHFVFPNNKGLKLYESNHVLNIQEFRPIEGLSVITGYVVRQTSVSYKHIK